MYQLTPNDTYEYKFTNNIEVSNYTPKTHLIQTIRFQDQNIHDLDITIDGRTLSDFSYSKDIDHLDIPVNFSNKGKVKSVTYHWSTPHEIIIKKRDSIYTLPLSEHELTQVFGAYLSKEGSKKIL